MKLFSVLLVFLVLIGCKHLKETQDPSGIKWDQATHDYGSLSDEAPRETEQWGQLAGEWECISRDLDTKDKQNPKWYSNKATWKWEYVLGGHAVLNRYWQEDVSPNPITKDFFATGIFIFNPKTNLWEAVVLNTRAHKISPKFQAAYNDGKIEMHDGSGKWLVTFYNIKKTSFEWKYEILSDDGNWEPISKISAVRKI